MHQCVGLWQRRRCQTCCQKYELRLRSGSMLKPTWGDPAEAWSEAHRGTQKEKWPWLSQTTERVPTNNRSIKHGDGTYQAKIPDDGPDPSCQHIIETADSRCCEETFCACHWSDVTVEKRIATASRKAAELAVIHLRHKCTGSWRMSIAGFSTYCWLQRDVRKLQAANTLVERMSFTELCLGCSYPSSPNSANSVAANCS